MQFRWPGGVVEYRCWDSQQVVHPAGVASEARQKLNRMTIVVGMVGSDGIVLAADRRMVRPARHVEEYNDTSSICKITHLARHAVAYAAAGDYIAWRAGRLLSQALDEDQFDFTRIPRSLESIGSEAFKYERRAIEETYTYKQGRSPLLAQTRDSLPRGLLIVFHGGQVPNRQLWGLNLQPTTSFAQSLTKAVYGAIGNPARFFGEYFIEQTPIAKLQFLAAHTVLTAHRFDSLMIGGLQVALFNENGYRLLDPEGISELQKQSEALDASIRDRLYGQP
jgi:hypothetical protein